jgi:drug/metabolite transporter (DMT)-like permease
MACILIGPFVSSIATLYIKAKLHDEKVLPVLALQISLGAIVTTIFALLFEDIHRFHLSTTSVGALIYLAIFGTIVTFSSYYWLLKRLPLLTMAMIAIITPVLSIFLGYVVLHEVLTLQDYLGSGLVLIGVLIVNLKSR